MGCQVARLAGVSHQTVSRVLNGHPNVKEQTRVRVRAAIAELGYRPNRAARALVTGRSQLLVAYPPLDVVPVVSAVVLLGGLAISAIAYRLMLRLGALPEPERVLR